MVAGEDQHRLGFFDQRQRGADRTAGAVGLRLLDRLDALGQTGREVATGRDDRGDAAGTGLARSDDRPGHHRAAADGVEHLRRRRAHPRALARRHNKH
jgi:hypothetical protein